MSSKAYLFFLLLTILSVTTSRASSHGEQPKTKIAYAKVVVPTPPLKAPSTPSPPLKAPSTPSPPTKTPQSPPSVKPPVATPPSTSPPMPPVRSKKDCIPLCQYRCQNHSRMNLCMRACTTCCDRCKCVPPGTYGNREKCGKCYTDMTTHGNKPKCP